MTRRGAHFLGVEAVRAPPPTGFAQQRNRLSKGLLPAPGCLKVFSRPKEVTSGLWHQGDSPACRSSLVSGQGDRGHGPRAVAPFLIHALSRPQLPRPPSSGAGGLEEGGSRSEALRSGCFKERRSRLWVQKEHNWRPGKDTVRNRRPHGFSNSLAVSRTPHKGR